MTETYCGKNCTDCPSREVLTCPGCKAGPGKQYSGDCQLAKCCLEKGHQECATCGFNGHCGTLRGKEQIPERRINDIETQKRQAAAIAKRAPILGKWLWILFWLIIPSTVASLMTNKTIVGWIPSISIPGLVLGAICSLVYGGILLKLASEEERYRTAGICSLISGAVGVLIACISGGGDAPTWTLLLSLPASILSLVGEYNEFTAHSLVLNGVDSEQAEQWTSLWKWYIGMFGVMLGSILLIAIAPILGLLVVLAAAIGVAIVGIVKLVYLYRTAKLFQAYKIEDIS